MGNNNTSTRSESEIVDPDDTAMNMTPDDIAMFMTLIDEISNEIDNEYKDDISIINTHSPSPNQHHLPDFVTHIDSINKLYTCQSAIGRGVSGSVFLAQSNQTYKQYALKKMPRSDRLNLFSFLREIKVLNEINHPNIVHFNGAYITDEHYYITTEYCSGGTLLERIIKMKRFSERDCVDYMKKILSAVQYLHSKNIAHRDLKLSNIVFDNTDINHSKLKLIDFGEGELITNHEHTKIDPVGSLHFFPPESIRDRKKGDLFAGDMWAVGVIAYILIEGRYPFNGKDIKSIMKSIDKYELQWNMHIPISDSCKDFIKSLLNKDMNMRLNAKQALEHPWIVSKAKDDDLGDEYFSTLKRLNFQNKLQRIMVNAALDGMDETDKKLILSHDGYEDDNQLINQIISGRTPTPTPKPYKHTAEISDKSLNDMDIENIFCEIDAETMSKQKPSLSPTMDDTITVERVVKILRSSSKKYDISQIIANVSDHGSEEITFGKIASYHQRMDSMESMSE